MDPVSWETNVVLRDHTKISLPSPETSPENPEPLSVVTKYRSLEPMLVLLVALLMACSSREFERPPQSSVLASISAALVESLTTSDLICLGEVHGSTRDAELRETLIRTPEFFALIDTIIIEFGNPLHQEILDRLVLDLEPLSREALRPVWIDAGMGEMWELPNVRTVSQSCR